MKGIVVIMIDGHGRKIDYIRISLTDLCNLRCRYCIPENGVEKKSHFDILRFEEIVDIVKASVKLGITKVRLTGGEPLVRKGVVSLVQMIRNVSGIRDITMTTNATMLEEFAGQLKEAGLTRVNISLDTLNTQKYEYITRGGDIGKALRGIEAAKKAGLGPIKINTVLMKGFNDDEIEDFVCLTQSESMDVRFIELMPIGGCAGSLVDTDMMMPCKEVLKRVPTLVREQVQESRVSVNYRLPGAKGRVGLISPINHQFCDRCNRLRVTADGKIKPCLHSDDEINIREMIGGGQTYQQVLEHAVMQKPSAHRLDENVYIDRCMNSIGG